jgi:hypothetical protein
MPCRPSIRIRKRSNWCRGFRARRNPSLAIVGGIIGRTILEANIQEDITLGRSCINERVDRFVIKTRA